jgi:hypothetical protein
MGETCSNPGCIRDAKYAVEATDAGSSTGKTFYTCEKHGMSSDKRVEL